MNTKQRMIIGWILRICLVVLVSNPTGVAGFEFPSLSSLESSVQESIRESFQGLRGTKKKQIMYQNQNNEDPNESSDYGFDEGAEGEAYSEDLDDEELTQEERELHPYYAYRSPYYRNNNVYVYRPAPVAPAYYRRNRYNNYNNFNNYNNNYGRRSNYYYQPPARRPNYFNGPRSNYYISPFDDWVPGLGMNADSYGRPRGGNADNFANFGSDNFGV